MAAIGRALGLGLSVSAATAACGTASSGGAAAQWDGGVDALAQEVILSTSGKHEIELDPSQVPDFAWQYDAEVPNPSPTNFMSGSGVGFVTCDHATGFDCTGATVEISDFRVWLQGSQGWVLAQSGAMGGSIEAESLEASTAMDPKLEGSNDAGTVQELNVPNGKTYNFYVNARFQDPAGFNGNFVVAITARVAAGGPQVRYGLMAGINWFQSTINGAAYSGGGLGRYIVLSSTPTTVGYTNVDPEALLQDPPAQE